MVMIGNDILLPGDVKVNIIPISEDVQRVEIHAQEGLLTLRALPDGPTGIMLELFQPEDANVELLTRAIAVLPSLLEHMDWQHVVALYPFGWRSYFEKLGFKHLSERIRWEMVLEPERVQPRALPEGVQLKPVTASVERLGELLSAAENNPAIPLALCVKLCRDILEGTFGPLIAQGCRELWIGERPVGVCLFTDYHGDALLSHIFIEHARQGQGLASTLLRHCLNGLVQAGYPKAIASTDATNTSSRRMHAQVGFAEVNPSLSCSMVKKANLKKGEAL